MTFGEGSHSYPVGSSNPDWKAARVAVALFPAVVMWGLSVWLNHFALIDDWVDYFVGRGPLYGALQAAQWGRFNFLHWIYFWAVAHIVGDSAASWSFLNGLSVNVAVLQVYGLTLRLGGSGLGAIGASWLFALNVATAENIFSLGKPEPRQIICILAVLLLLIRALGESGARGSGHWEGAWLFISASSAILFKESGVLLAVPLVVVALITAAQWRVTGPLERRRRLVALAAAGVPVATGSLVAWFVGLRRGSYGREQILAAPMSLDNMNPALYESEAVLAVLIAGGILAGVALALAPGKGRASAAIVLADVAAFAAFYTYARSASPYFYFTAAGPAMCLIGSFLLPAERKGPWRRVAGMAVVGVFLALGGVRAMATGSALSAWSWLHHHVVRAVADGRPRRVVFHQSGHAELYIQAYFAWALVGDLPIEIGVLDSPHKVDPVKAVASHELRPGDWIMEEFGSPQNVGLPLRGLQATRSLDDGLMGSAGAPLLPIRLMHAYKASFSYPSGAFDLHPGRRHFLEWRIYEVTERPLIILSGLSGGRWMERAARLWIRPKQVECVALRFWPFDGAVRAGSERLELIVRDGGRTLHRCPSAPAGVSTCIVDTRGLGSADVDWIGLELHSSFAVSPLSLGRSADPRALSFNFSPTWETGLAGLLGSGRACDGRRLSGSADR